MSKSHTTVWAVAFSIAGLFLPDTRSETPLDFPPPDFPDMPADDEPRTSIDDLLYEALNDVIDENFHVAIPKLEKVILEQPSAIPAWESLGWAYWKTGRPDDAVRLWRDLVTLNPRVPQAYNLLGMAATAQDDLDQAVTYYRKSLELDPTQFHTRLSLGRIYRWRGQLNEAEAILGQLLAEDPDRLDVRLELARAQLQNWNFQEAEPNWRAVHQTRPDHPEYVISLAASLLSNNRVDEARDLINAALRQNPNNLDALTLLADIHEYGQQPEDAVPVLKRIINNTTDTRGLHTARTRLVRLYVRLYRTDEKKFPLDDAIRVTHDMVEADPANTDTRLLLGELYSLNLQFDAAEEHLRYVLEHLNPHNQRAHRGLFEVYLGQRAHRKAEEQLEIIHAFNPDDPYYYYRLARLESGRGRFHRAYDALDKLEEAGRQGAVAVLLYHAISPSDWSQTPSVRRLREQLLALKEAGYRFITPEQIPDYFASMVSSEQKNTPDRVVVVTFDDALRSSMEYGTQVAQELGIPMAQFVITGYVERGDPFISTWEELRAYRDTGHWRFHSQLVLAEQRSPVDEILTIGLPLANRLWLPAENRMETEDEYFNRLEYEYRHSRELLRQHIGGGQRHNAVAYPLGEIGQETRSNVRGAIPANLAAASRHFDMGFVQSPFGHAVKGDNPFLYQRHELHRSAEGPEALAQAMENHPFYLAHRMRAEMAALQGKVRLASRTLEELEEYGYPSNSLARVTTYVNDRAARRFAAPPAAERARKGALDFGFSQPYLGLEGAYFRDNLTRRNYHVDVLGGMNVTPRLTLEGRAGWGQLRQTPQERAVDGVIPPSVKLEIDETRVGLKSSYVATDSTLFSGHLLQRDFSAPADNAELAYGLQGMFRPVLWLDVMAEYEHDVVESARSVVEGVTHDLYSLHTMFHLTDWWDLWLSGMYYDFSDDNDRSHLNLRTSFLVYEPIGLYLGARYGYATSDQDRDDYWTPYKLHRYYLEALLRKNYLRVYYNIGVRAGIGRQAVRPEAKEAFAELVDRARIEAFDPGPAPEEDWETIYGVFASTRIRLGPNWEANGEIAYSKLPDYNELNISAGLTYKF